MAKPDTWMPLKIEPWTKKTARLSLAERGAYMDLLLAYWVGGPLPADDEDTLKRMARCTDKEWKQVRVKVLAFFTRDGDVLRQGRADEELADAAARYERRAAAGRSGGQAKAKQTPKQNPSNATAEPQASYKEQSSNDETDANASVGRKRPPPKRSTALPADWTLSQEGFDHATAKGLDPATIRAVAEHFRDDNAAKGRTSKDWNASWRTWITKHIGWYGTGPWPKGKQLVSNRQGPEGVIAAGAAVIARLQANGGLRSDCGGYMDEASDAGDGVGDNDGFADGPCIDATHEPERDRRVAHPFEA